MASSTDNLYVTLVDVDRDLLKVWGQRNRIGATYIERQLLHLVPEFNRTLSPDPSRIRKGMFCFAKYTDDNYYRARVISNVQGDVVRVLFVDYGNKDCIHISNIRIQEGKNEDILSKITEQADEYYLAGVVAPQGGWTNEIISEIRRDICYEIFAYEMIAKAGDQKILEIKFRNENFSSFLVKKQMARPVSLSVQSQMILSYCSLVSNESKLDSSFREIPRVNASVPHSPGISGRVSSQFSSAELQQQYKYGKTNSPINFSQSPCGQFLPSRQYSPSRQMHNMNKTSPTDSYYASGNHLNSPPPLSENLMQPVNPSFNSMICNQFNPVKQMTGSSPPPLMNSLNNVVIEALAQQVKQYIDEDNAKAGTPEAEKTPHNYVNTVLEIGSTHNVFISNIDDGPWSFSVQLVSSETELNKLMEELAVTELLPIKPPIILGHPCIGSSVLYGNLCRGVIVSVSHSAVKVYFVDFGSTEDLLVSSIYELPPKFFKTRVLSQKFSLSGLQKVVYSDDIKRFFKEVVQDELLMLRVISLEGDNLPSCELYLKEKNIKRILNEKIRESRSSAQEEVPKVGDTESVVVTWVESPQKFFVQLHRKDPELNALKKELSEVRVKGQPLSFRELSVGLRCVGLYESDGQWYRVVITSISSENAVTVSYIDYGNSETVRISLLRKIDGSGLINQMNIQAIQCSLKGFENESFDQKKANILEDLILEKDLNMKVVSTEKDNLCVLLFENGKDITPLLMASLYPKVDNHAYKSQVNENDWNKRTAPRETTQTNSNRFEMKKKFYENESFEKKDNWSLRGDKNRQMSSRAKNNNSRHFSDFKSDKPQSKSTHINLNRRSEGKGNRRDDKQKSDDRKLYSNDDFGTIKGFRQDKESNWKERKPAGGDKFAVIRGFKQGGDGRNDPKSNSSESKFTGIRSFKQDGENDELNDRGDNKFVGRNKVGGDKGGKTEFGDKELERKDRDDSFTGGDFDRKKKFQGDKSEKPFYGNDKRDKKFEGPRKQPINKEDLPTPRSKFEERTIKINSCEKVIITYYFNPHEFYVQVLTHEDYFKKMMHDIQLYYSNKYPLRNELERGDIVISQFSVDNILYRGEIIKPSPVTVRYVDYGNQEVVEPKRTWAVVNQFLKLPKQAVKCRLSNIQPLGSEWPPQESDIEKFFEFEEYKCTFLDVENGIYEVRLETIDSGKDVASEIISAGLGTPMSSKINIEEIDYSLLPSQVLKLYISHVESPSKFYVIINPKSVEKIDEEINAYVKNMKNLVSLEESCLKPGMYCISTHDEVSWHRGTIKTVAGNKVSVWFNDRGDSLELTIDKIRFIPEHLRHFQSQAVECSLNGILDSEMSKEEFKDAVELKHFLVSIISENDKRLSVVLYDQDGQILDLQKSSDFPQSIEPISHHPITTQKSSLIITHVESPKEIYIQSIVNKGNTESVKQQLASFYDQGDKQNIEIDKKDCEKVLVAAKSVVHKSWRRGRVLSSFENTLKIFYIDFGNKESLPLENVKKLDASFYALNALAKKVALDVNYSIEMTEAIKNKLLELTQGKELFGYFVNIDGDFILEFTDNGSRITPMLKSLGSISLSVNDKLEEILPKKEMSVSSKKEEFDLPESDGLKVVVSHIDNPKRFWVHKESVINDLLQFQEKLQKCCETLPDKRNVKPGDVVAAMYCGMWYRAEVLNIDRNNITVQFLDYGNTLDVDLNCNTVKELTAELIEVPIFATCYSLKGTWNEKATDKFEEIILQCDDSTNVVIVEEGDPAVVDLLKDGQSIVEKLMEVGVGLAKGFEEQFYTPVYLSNCNSPEDFYIQKESCTEILEVIVNALFDADMFEDVSSVQENEIYVGKFPEDWTWYRVKVLKKYSDETQVFFIDYGNISNVTELKCLPTDLVDIPPLAENCCLIYGQSCDSWSEAACARLREYLDEQQLKMKVVVNRVKKPIVELYSKNGKISEELAALCEPDGRSEVYVSQVHSHSDFYIQYVNDEYFKLIILTLENGSKLEVFEDAKPGTLCVARFVNDGLWYRAKILQNLDEGFEVFFIDYGNVSVSTELKKLPQEIEEIPPRALRCSLDLPEKNIPESVKEEFINLTSNCEAVFRARIITPGDVNIISLKLNGRILEQTLCLDSIVEENISRFSESPNDETDDDKNSKISIMTENYLSSNLEDDVRAATSIRNETDEEKRVKIAISVVDGGGSEGFKSDDEKGISETMVLSSIVNATDNELIEESQENVEETKEELDSNTSSEDFDEEGEIPNEVNVENDENPQEVTVDETMENEEKTENNGDDTEILNEESSVVEVKEQKVDRNKVHKIVPGSISRGESEKDLNKDPQTPAGKLSHSEKLLPGSISRGVSLETMPSGNEQKEESSAGVSQSAPNTPKLSRRNDTVAYTKVDQNDRLVPSCISTGMPLVCGPFTERASPVEKIVPGSVNGSTLED